MIVLTSGATRATEIPDLAHYTINGDSIAFTWDATDNDVTILDSHRGVTTVDIGANEAWDGIDPRLVPIKITNRGFAHIANCKKLQILRFSSMHPLQVTDEGLKSLEGLEKLREIRFFVTPFSSAGLTHLTGLINLEELWLEFNSKYDDAAMDSIASLKKLRVLRFYGAPITDTGITKIRGLSQLEDLQLGKSCIGDDALKIIGGFVRLKTLDLQYTRVTDAGMSHLKSLTNLQWLCLKGTAVTGKGLANLSDMTELKSLYLDEMQADNLPPELTAKLKGNAQPTNAPYSSPAAAGLKR